MSVQLRALLIAAFTIVVLFLIGDRLGLRTNSTEPRDHVMLLDTATIVSIRFEDRRDERNDLFLERSSVDPGTWVSPSRDASAATELAGTLMTRFRRIPVKRDMGMIKLLGERYDLTDKALCRIAFTSFDGREDVLHLGSSTFAPGRTGAWTYVNIPGERHVYAVEGHLLKDLRRPDRQVPVER